MTRLSIAAFDTGSVPTPLCNNNQHKVQQSGGVTKGKYSTTEFLNTKKPSVFIFKAARARCFTQSKGRRRKEKLQRAYCLTAGSVSVPRDYLYSTPTALRLHKTGDIPSLCG